MRYLIIILTLQMLIVAQAPQGYAGLAEASVTSEHHYRLQYDLSGLSERERDWFLTFIRGNFFADGWDQIGSYLLQQVAQEEREHQRQMLDQLGTKIGREWCRDNEVRRIDNSMLSEWGSQLKKAAKNEPERLGEVIRNIDGEVNSLLD